MSENDSVHAFRAALVSAADALAKCPPMTQSSYVATLRLYAAEPWRLVIDLLVEADQP